MNQRITMAINEIFSAVNSFGRESEQKAAVVAAFRSQHRTLQQNLMRLVILPILTHLANSWVNGIYDARNEASCRLAQRMLAAVNEDDTYLPYI